MAWTQRLGQLRSPVSTYSNLPITGNVLGDVRLSTDTGDAYTWMLVATSGSLTDWKKVTTSSYSDLDDAPFSSALAIDDAVKVVTGLAINVGLLAYQNLSYYYATLARMFDGVVSRFYYDEDGIEVDKCENQLFEGSFYLPNKGDLDIYTKMLIHGDGIQGSSSFMDLLRHEIAVSGAITDTTTKKFGTGSIKFDGTNDYFDVLYSSLFFDVSECLDFWFYGLTGVQPILVNAANLYLTEGEAVSIKKNSSNKIEVLMSVIVDYDEESGDAIYDDITVTSASAITASTWTHIAIQRIADGNIQIWINGVLDATSTQDFTGYTNLGQGEGFSNRFGKSLSTYLNGYLDEIRFSNTTRYTTTFTPMTKAYNTATTPAPTPTIVDISAGAKTVTPLGNARMSGSNPLFGNASLYLDGINSYLSLADSNDWKLANLLQNGDDSTTKLLLHFDNSFQDSVTNKTVTNNGVTFSSSVKKFGSHSAQFSGNTTGGVGTYLSIPNSNDFNFGHDNFTIDLWFYAFTMGSSAQYTFLYTSNGLDKPWVGILIGLEQYGSTIYTYFNIEGLVSSQTPDIIANQWNHMAMVRNGNLFSFYINGILVDSKTADVTFTNVTGPLLIGRRNESFWNCAHNGYLDEIRISKGIARWTSNFTPPTLPYASTALLLHLDNNVTDEAGKVVTNNGVTFSSSVKKFGTHAAYFNGSSYLSIPDSDDFNFGSGDFTIDYWFQKTEHSSPDDIQQHVGKFQNANNQWLIQNTVGPRFYFYLLDGGVTRYVYISWEPTLSTWYHVAVTRASGVFYIFINGVSQTVESYYFATTDSIPNISAPLSIGNVNGYYYNGLIDELRITKGIARWTSSFTPPTSAYTVDAPSDYTVDLWVDPLSLNDANTFIIGQEDSWKLTLDGSSNKYLKYTVVGGTSIIAPIALSLETWSHVAIVQKDGVIKLYVNGILGASVAGSATVNGTSVLSIGADSTGAHMFNGFIEEVRISDNARWAAAFTPPVVEYSSDSNTKLLLPLNVQTVPNMVLQSVGYVSNYVPTSARVVIFEEDIDTMEPNVDLKIEVSRDGGATFSPCLIAKDQEFGDGTLNLFTGSLDLRSQPNGELLVWKLTTQNNKDCRIRGISLNWR